MRPREPVAYAVRNCNLSDRSIDPDGKIIHMFECKCGRRVWDEGIA